MNNTQDPYLNNKLVEERLYDEYYKYTSLLVAFDFDNTIFDYHRTGCEYPEVVNLLHKAKYLNCTLICYTGNPDEELVKEELDRLNIKYDYYNTSPLMFGVKPFANILLDDRAGLPSAFAALNNTLNKIEQERN